MKSKRVELCTASGCVGRFLRKRKGLFEYDAAGNRTLMEDASGEQTYAYDQLSRLTSETRSFNGLSGTFTISYASYNLAGQLTSLAEPTQFGSTISYGYDVTGRLSSVTGSSFGGVTTYASSHQYRAAGGLKSLTYGNNKTLSATYNARLQAASFTIPNLISKTYDYYADGRLRFSSDLLEHKFDRFYSHDHAAQIKQAFSGAEARFEGTTNDRPYRQTFDYDAIGHLTARTSAVWNSGFSTNDTYVNNRRSFWNYDADGRLLAGNDQVNTHDAAGRTHTVMTSLPETLVTRGLDGDGRQVKTAEEVLDEQTQTWSTTTKYYLYSSVLGRQLLTEIASDGTKLRTFVYAEGSVLAWQVAEGSPRVVWEHNDPSGASYRTTDVNGYTLNNNKQEEPAELDPTGANAMYAILEPPNPPEELLGSLVPYPSMSDPRNPGTSYTVDGVPVSTDYFLREINLGFVAGSPTDLLLRQIPRKHYSVWVPDTPRPATLRSQPCCRDGLR